ncbi:MAG: hypothetical protein ISS68_14760 [Desulfobacteraceae bacterium]|nr:hypothetical protein [Desulfobacteraceae bacterium]
MAPPKGDGMRALAAMCTHVPDKGEQLVRYYGFYSNVSRGRRKKQEQDDIKPSILETEGSSKAYRKNWARLIQKIYEADPLKCPKCSGSMRILSFIEDEQVIEKILRHLGLCEIKARPPPKANAPPLIDYSASQLPPSEDYFYSDVNYHIKDYAS